MNCYQNELFIFGGVYPRPDPTPDECSNTLHIFNLKERNWYKPPVCGTLPTARSGHSANLVEDDLYIFGGWDMPDLFNDTFRLDLTTLEFTKLDIGGKTPKPRRLLLIDLV